MNTITVLCNGVALTAPPHTLLSDLLPANRAFEMPCGGKGICGKCKVTAQGALSPISDTEVKHLTQKEIAAGVRLACCCYAEGNCTVRTDKSGFSYIQSGFSMPVFPFDPLFEQYGIAVDIGTTTVVAQLYSRDGLLAQTSSVNSQTQLGSDVISRIEASLAGKEAILADCIQAELTDFILNLCRQQSISPEDIDAMVITGNTAMLYLLTQRSPEKIATAPFEADCLFGEMLMGEQLNLPCQRAKIYLPRCISAFVGADITTAVLASGMLDTEDTTMLADIGTNGEIVLRHQGNLLCCSTAAGPAFEGAGLSMGMQGKNGAIDHVTINDEGHLLAHVLGDTSPIGICGSGVMDAVACLLQTGGMDETGRLEKDPFVISVPVQLTQSDVRKIQLAKSAVCAGMETLLFTARVNAQQVQTLFIAGGFGSYVNLDSAANIGLIPAQLIRSAAVLGNAALCGAAMILLQKNFLETTNSIARRAQTVDLSSSAVFMEKYTDGMFFPVF